MNEIVIKMCLIQLVISLFICAVTTLADDRDLQEIVSFLCILTFLPYMVYGMVILIIHIWNY